MNSDAPAAIDLMPPAFAEGLDDWSCGDGTPGSPSYDRVEFARLVNDPDFGTCLELRKIDAEQRLRYMGEVLNDGYSIIIFPEGERRAEGQIAPFRGGIGMIGSRLGVPVVPVRVEGLDRVLDPKMRWPKRGPVRVAFGAPIRLVGEDYQALARQVEDAVRNL